LVAKFAGFHDSSKSIEENIKADFIASPPNAQNNITELCS
jgi:hypothetical protein